MGASMIRDLAAAIIRDGKVPSDWEQSFIVCFYKGKGDALERGNYRGLKLTEQVMKVLERIVDGLIRQVVSTDDSQFGFVPGRGTTDAIFVIRQLQDKYLAANKRLYMAFVDLEKAFDRVPRKVIWWALRKLGVDEWIVRLVQGMYSNARSRVRVGDGYSEEFEVKVGVHQGSVPGLEKLTNANRSVSSVSDRLFPVELTEIADWKSISEYMLHSNFGKALTYRQEFRCIYLYIAASLFTKYLSIFLDVLSAERILKQNKNTSEFPRINLCYFRRQAHSSSSVRVQSAK